MGHGQSEGDRDAPFAETEAKLNKIMFMLYGIGAGVFATLVISVITLVTRN